nr:TGS domain-containing protein [Pyrinomonadaceae bacterium]
IDELRKTVEKLLLPLVETTQAEDSQDFIESLKLDLYPKDIFAFTPMGKVIQLPLGATPIDFAYAIHTKVGDTCNGAKVNGRIMPLRTEIKNGDVIEILTSPNSNPSRDWLNFVTTSKARSHIRQFIAQQQRDESIELGRKMLIQEAERFKVKQKEIFDETVLKRIANEYGYGRNDDLIAAIGYGKTLPRNVLAKFLGKEKFEELDPERKKESTIQAGFKAAKKFIGLGDDGIIVKGVDNLLLNRAKCCNPLRGEEIIGYISLGKGVVIHNKRCKNVKQLMVNKERIVEVEWAVKEDTKQVSAVRLLALTENRTGMLAGITNAIAEIKTSIRDARAEVSKDDQGFIEVTVEVFDKKHLDKVISAIKGVSGVLDVERLSG